MPMPTHGIGFANRRCFVLKHLFADCLKSWVCCIFDEFSNMRPWHYRPPFLPERLLPLVCPPASCRSCCFPSALPAPQACFNSSAFLCTAGPPPPAAPLPPSLMQPLLPPPVFLLLPPPPLPPAVALALDSFCMAMSIAAMCGRTAVIMAGSSAVSSANSAELQPGAAAASAD